jgi:restriction endonuclease S subunit
VAIPALNVGDLQNMLIPCPSIDEQRKLVEKYEVKLEIIASTKKRLEELKNDLQNLADQL